MKILLFLTTYLMIMFQTSAQKDWPGIKRYAADNEVRKQTVQKDRVVFMGNSITEAWERIHPEFFTSNPYVCRGISGQTTPQMLIRFRPDVINLKPKVVVILAGINDIAENTGPTTLELIAGNLFSMAELAKANGIKVVLSSVLPATSFSWSPVTDPADKVIELNSMIKDYAKKHKLVYVDYYSPMVNDTRGLKEELGSDSVHPNMKGYQVMEPLVQAAINKAMKKR